MARDVRVLRQRRKQASEEAVAQWELVQTALPERQRVEKQASIMQLRVALSSMTAADVATTKAGLLEQLQMMREELNKMRSKVDQMSSKDAPQPDPVRKDASKSGGIGRKLSFGKKDKEKLPPPVTAAPASSAAPPLPVEGKEENQVVRKSSFGKGNTITRVLSFGRSGKNKEKTEAPPEESSDKKKSASTAGSLVRKLSFGKKK